MISLSSTTAISFSFRPALINLLPPPPMSLPSAGTPFAAKTHLLHLCSATSSNANRPESSGFDGSSIEKQVPEDFPTVTVLGSNGKDDNSQAVSSNEILARLKRYGISGILSYGLLNTAYYLTTFLVVWFYVTPAPGRMGYLAAVERFLKVMAMVWAGSQVTKLMRAGGALALAPVVDRGLSWFTIKFGFESQGKVLRRIVVVPCVWFLMLVGIVIFTGVCGDCWLLLWFGILDVCCGDLTFGINSSSTSTLSVNRPLKPIDLAQIAMDPLHNQASFWSDKVADPLPILEQ